MEVSTRTVRDSGKLILVNVSGKRFETFEETLSLFPDTLLGSPTERQKYFNENAGEYFFDRHRGSFAAILYFYQSNGSLIRPDQVPVHVFYKECVFFQLPEEIVETFQIESGVMDEEEERPMPVNPICKIIWETMEYPDTSLLAKTLAILSVIIISASLVIFCLETMPVFNPPPPDCLAELNSTSTTTCPEKENYVNPYERVWFVMNCAIIGWFTLEYVTRLLVCPNILVFLVAPLNIIDLLSILPFYVTLALSNVGGSIDVLRVVRVVRVFRVFKLSRHSRGLQILGNTLRSSFSELVMLGFFLFIGVMIFGSCVYYAELGEDSGFDSIPHSFWWAIVTMTTVGYGDVYPTTFFGKITGALCVISGVLSIALPVPVVVSNFEQFYQKELNRRRQEKDKKDEEQKREKEEKLQEKSGSSEGLDDENTAMMSNGENSAQSPTNV